MIFYNFRQKLIKFDCCLYPLPRLSRLRGLKQQHYCALNWWFTFLAFYFVCSCLYASCNIKSTILRYNLKLMSCGEWYFGHSFVRKENSMVAILQGKRLTWKQHFAILKKFNIYHIQMVSVLKFWFVTISEFMSNYIPASTRSK